MRIVGWIKAAGHVATGALIVLQAATAQADASAVKLQSVLVRSSGSGASAVYDGVVEALRQSVIAAQVSGPVVEVAVRTGDSVKAGQLLVRIDARAAEQTAAASEAQVRAARAALDLATSDFERQRQLAQQQFISPAALERAQSEYRAAQAQAAAQVAGAGAARTQAGFYVVRAPYAGVVADVLVQGEMALPGRTLVTLYDPAALRVSAAVPQTATTQLAPDAPVRLEVPGLPKERQWIAPKRVQVLPTIDAATHTQTLRLDLPAGLAGLVPGQFARVWLPSAPGVAQRLLVPASAVLQRAELSALYVLDKDGRPLLRQVRLGQRIGPDVEVLSGVSADERVALDAQTASRAR